MSFGLSWATPARQGSPGKKGDGTLGGPCVPPHLPALSAGVLRPLVGSWPHAKQRGPDPRLEMGHGPARDSEFVTHVVSGFHGSFEILPQEDVCQGGLSVSEPRAATARVSVRGVCVCARARARATQERKEGAGPTLRPRRCCERGELHRAWLPGSPTPWSQPRGRPGAPLAPSSLPPRQELLTQAGDGAPAPVVRWSLYLVSSTLMSYGLAHENIMCKLGI